MAFLTLIKESLNSGDPTVRTWFTIQSYWAPFLCSILYVSFVKQLGPAIMRNRQPFNLRLLMIAYNFCIVFVYTCCILTVTYYFLTTDAYKKVCTPSLVVEGHYSYYCSTVGWYISVIKYVEYADTVFLVLRKKSHLITNLHVIHHTVLPIIGWVILRTETSGFQLIPGVINAFTHIIMYTYYGLAAMGPEVQKKLWWKKYLTMLQMAQFVVIFLFTFAIVPLSGCKTSPHGIYLDIIFTIVFFAMFYNFYIKTYKKSSSDKLGFKANGVNGVNGLQKQNGESRKDS